ncbi:interleukin-1 receptor-associated kinase 4 [Ceratobasidium sp. AG-Ba]|nr:interleukin-1 receptor-associated kinase 4 [Ceratobasidium sp. AG-Ba]
MQRGGHPSALCAGFDLLEPVWNPRTECIACGKLLFTHNILESAVSRIHFSSPQPALTGVAPPTPGLLAVPPVTHNALGLQNVQSIPSGVTTLSSSSGRLNHPTSALMGGYSPRFRSNATPPTAGLPGSSSLQQSASVRLRSHAVTNARHLGVRNPRTMPNLPSGQSSNLVHQSHAVAASRVFEALVAVFPMAIFESDMDEISEDERFKHQRLNYPKDHLQSCLQHLDENGLLVSITLPYNLGGPAFHQQFADIISTHLNNHVWQSPPLRAGGNAFERWPFCLVTPAQRRQRCHLDKPRTPLVANTFTGATLSACPFGSTIPNAHNNNQNCFILFVVPVGRNMIGRVDRFPGAPSGPLGLHKCAAHRAIEGWDEEKFNHPDTSHIGCWPDCSSVANEDESDDELPEAAELLASQFTVNNE